MLNQQVLHLKLLHSDDVLAVMVAIVISAPVIIEMITDRLNGKKESQSDEEE